MHFSILFQYSLFLISEVLLFINFIPIGTINPYFNVPKFQLFLNCIPIWTLYLSFNTPCF
jgi:hypothetical protein